MFNVFGYTFLGKIYWIYISWRFSCILKLWELADAWEQRMDGWNIRSSQKVINFSPHLVFTFSIRYFSKTFSIHRNYKSYWEMEFNLNFYFQNSTYILLLRYTLLSIYYSYFSILIILFCDRPYWSVRLIHFEKPKTFKYGLQWTRILCTKCESHTVCLASENSEGETRERSRFKNDSESVVREMSLTRPS